MATVTFHPGMSWDHHPAPEGIVLLRQDVLADRLAKLRAEWEAAKQDLGQVNGPVDAMLDEFAEIIGLNEPETNQVFETKVRIAQ